MKVAKQKRHSFHPRIGCASKRKMTVVMYRGVNLKHQDEEVYEMTSRVHSTQPIVVSIGVLARSTT